MLTYLKDKLNAARLKARYQRLVQERLLNFVESTGPQPVADDAAGWLPLGGDKQAWSETDRVDLRSKARQLVAKNPHARNVLRALEIYVVGSGPRLSHAVTDQNADAETLRKAADHLWSEFLAINRRHFSYREFARRTWRDGECFLRLFSALDGPPAVRFVDPERLPKQPIIPRPTAS